MKEIPIIILKPGKERALKNFHPWLFSGAIKKKPSNLSPGDVVKIISNDSTELAVGFFVQDEGLSIRIFSFEDFGAPNDLVINTRLEAARSLRNTLGLPNDLTNAYRLIHGEGDALSGLVCDIYNKTASIKLSNPGLKPYMPVLLNFLREKLSIETLCFEEDEGRESEAVFLEGGLSFVAHIGDGQKTGHFLDQRENRALLRHYAKGRRVLDAFCYSGGFSLYAIAGGAAHVSSVDISEKAISYVNDHIMRNGPFIGTHKSVVSDCFEYLRKIKPGEFDLIILDPPAFAKSAASVERAARGYKDINLSAMKALNPGSLLFTFSCSQHISADLFKKIVFGAAKDLGKDLSIIHELGQAPDHPVSIFCPQSSYLKGLVLYVK